LKEFAQWLAGTYPSVLIQQHNSWSIPVIQSIHIAAIAILVGSVFLIEARILGWAGGDQTLRQTTNRFGAWITGSLWVLLVTGILMVVGEPVRELVTFSFWAKMFLVAVGAVVAVVFLRSVRRNEVRWEDAAQRGPAKFAALITCLMWVSIIILGRLIAYDHIWGSWSPATVR
jgi:hypothetical protein